jgi:hypothetical protein
VDRRLKAYFEGEGGEARRLRDAIDSCLGGAPAGKCLEMRHVWRREYGAQHIGAGGGFRRAAAFRASANSTRLIPEPRRSHIHDTQEQPRRSSNPCPFGHGCFGASVSGAEANQTAPDSVMQAPSRHEAATVVGAGDGDETCIAVTNSAYGYSPSWVCVVVSVYKSQTGEYGDTDPDCFAI